MATVKLEKVSETRNFNDLQSAMITFIGTLAAADIVYTSQVIKVAEKPSEYWAAIIIWSDDAP